MIYANALRRITFGTLLVGLIVGFGGFATSEAAPQIERVPGQYIVVLRDDVARADVVTDELVAAHGLGRLHSYTHALKGFAATIPAGQLQKISDDPRVAFVSEDRVVTAFGKPGSGPAPQPSQTLPSGIDRINAEGNANTGAGIDVAVIDTGIDANHPDLTGAVVGGVNCSTGKNYFDGNGHGTHVAGTIAARSNSIGVVGVAPSARLWSVRVLNNAGSGTWSSIICGLDYVTAHAPANGGPIKVANLSLGGGGESDNNCGVDNSDALHQAICRTRDAGVTIVVAAGNEAADASTSVPAAYDDAVITVSALADSDGQLGGFGGATAYGTDDTFASFSNFGSTVDLAAPGVGIRSTWKGGGYNAISGTSMAAPHVSGAAALYIAAHPNAAWNVVRDALVGLGEVLGAGHTDPSGLHSEPVLRADTL